MRSKRQSELGEKIFTKTLLFTSFLLMTFSPVMDAKEVMRSKRQSELPPNFQCELCDKCNVPCSKSCALCAGCELALSLGYPAPGCDPCKGGVKACEDNCEKNQEGCKFCQYC